MATKKYLCSAPRPENFEEKAASLLASFDGDEKKRDEAARQTLESLKKIHKPNTRRDNRGRKSMVELAISFYEFVLGEEGKWKEAASINDNSNNKSKDGDFSSNKDGDDAKDDDDGDDDEEDDDDDDDADADTSSSDGSSSEEGRCSKTVESMDSTEFLNRHNDVCDVCSSGGELLCCSTCNLVFHLKCVRPVLNQLPTGDWSCAHCIISGTRGHKHNSRAWKTSASAVRFMGRLRSEFEKKRQDKIASGGDDDTGDAAGDTGGGRSSSSSNAGGKTAIEGTKDAVLSGGENIKSSARLGGNENETKQKSERNSADANEYDSKPAARTTRSDKVSTDEKDESIQEDACNSPTPTKRTTRSDKLSTDEKEKSNREDDDVIADDNIRIPRKTRSSIGEEKLVSLDDVQISSPKKKKGASTEDDQTSTPKRNNSAGNNSDDRDQSVRNMDSDDSPKKTASKRTRSTKSDDVAAPQKANSVMNKGAAATVDATDKVGEKAEAKNTFTEEDDNSNKASDSAKKKNLALYKLADDLAPKMKVDDSETSVRGKRPRKQPALFDPQRGPASRWQSDEMVDRVTEASSDQGDNKDNDDDTDKGKDKDDAKDKDEVKDIGPPRKKPKSPPPETKNEINDTADKDQTTKVEEVKQIDRNDGSIGNEMKPEKFVVCNFCRDDPSIPLCVFCACRVCFSKKDREKTLLCDKCDDEYHIYCLTPPLDAVPTKQQWFCPKCAPLEAKLEAKRRRRAASKVIDNGATAEANAAAATQSESNKVPAGTGRPRGRPPKIKTTPQVPPPADKRGRGRPPKLKTSTQAATPVRTKSPVPASGQKRGPGRPPKSSNTPTGAIGQSPKAKTPPPIADMPAQKRGPGRPPKASNTPPGAPGRLPRAKTPPLSASAAMPVQKRGPGRPPKTSTLSAQAAQLPKARAPSPAVVPGQKRGPGRPPKTSTTPTGAPGRPPKITVPGGKPRGRPPKSHVGASSSAPTPRKRGRPPKNPNATSASTSSNKPKKRGRGRPPKNPHAKLLSSDGRKRERSASREKRKAGTKKARLEAKKVRKASDGKQESKGDADSDRKVAANKSDDGSLVPKKSRSGRIVKRNSFHDDLPEGEQHLRVSRRKDRSEGSAKEKTKWEKAGDEHSNAYEGQDCDGISTAEQYETEEIEYDDEHDEHDSDEIEEEDQMEEYDDDGNDVGESEIGIDEEEMEVDRIATELGISDAPPPEDSYDSSGASMSESEGTASEEQLEYEEGEQHGDGYDDEEGYYDEEAYVGEEGYVDGEQEEVESEYSLCPEERDDSLVEAEDVESLVAEEFPEAEEDRLDEEVAEEPKEEVKSDELPNSELHMASEAQPTALETQPAVQEAPSEPVQPSPPDEIVPGPIQQPSDQLPTESSSLPVPAHIPSPLIESQSKLSPAESTGVGPGAGPGLVPGAGFDQGMSPGIDGGTNPPKKVKPSSEIGTVQSTTAKLPQPSAEPKAQPPEEAAPPEEKAESKEFKSNPAPMMGTTQKTGTAKSPPTHSKSQPKPPYKVDTEAVPMEVKPRQPPEKPEAFTIRTETATTPVPSVSADASPEPKPREKLKTEMNNPSKEEKTGTLPEKSSAPPVVANFSQSTPVQEQAAEKETSVNENKKNPVAQLGASGLEGLAQSPAVSAQPSARQKAIDKPAHNPIKEENPTTSSTKGAAAPPKPPNPVPAIPALLKTPPPPAPVAPASASLPTFASTSHPGLPPGIDMSVIKKMVESARSYKPPEKEGAPKVQPAGPVRVPRRKPGARECMQISRRFGNSIIPKKYMDTLMDYCSRGKVEHLIRMRERLDEHSRYLECQLAGLEALVREKGETDVKVPPLPERLIKVDGILSQSTSSSPPNHQVESTTESVDASKRVRKPAARKPSTARKPTATKVVKRGQTKGAAVAPVVAASAARPAQQTTKESTNATPPLAAIRLSPSSVNLKTRTTDAVVAASAVSTTEKAGTTRPTKQAK